MLKLPATCSTRAASPNRFATAVTWASRAAPYLTSSGVAPAARTWAAAALSVTVTTTVPDASRYEPAVRAPSWLTSALAVAGPAAGAAVGAAAWAGCVASSAPATRPAAARVIAARRTQVRVVVTAEPPVWAGSAPGIARPEGDAAW